MSQLQQYEAIIQTCLLVVLLFVLVLGNSLICAVVWKYKNLRTYANFFVVEMALVDLFNGIINIPLFICYQVYPMAFLKGRTVAIICLYCRRGFLLQNALSVSMIFIDRYLVLAYGLIYTSWKGKKKLFAIIATKWLIGIALVGAVIFFHSDFEELGEEGKTLIAKYISQYEDHGILPYPRIILPAFLIQFCIVFYLSSREIKKTVSFRKRLKGIDTKRFQDLKAMKTVRYIILCYAICFLPDIIRSVLLPTNVKVDKNWLVFIAFLFLLLTGVVNVVMYYVRTERFRRALLRIVSHPMEMEGVFEFKTYEPVIPKFVRDAKKLEPLEFSTDQVLRPCSPFSVYNKEQDSWDTRL